MIAEGICCRWIHHKEGKKHWDWDWMGQMSKKCLTEEIQENVNKEK